MVTTICSLPGWVVGDGNGFPVQAFGNFRSLVFGYRTISESFLFLEEGIESIDKCSGLHIDRNCSALQLGKVLFGLIEVSKVGTILLI